MFAFLGMKMQDSVMPAQCMKCGATYDLWYDLNTGQDLSDAEHFCWICRDSESKSAKRVEEFEGSVEESDFEGLELGWE